MTEKWKDLVGYEGLYKISDQGNVWSERRQRLLSTKPNKHRGYPEFCVVGLDGKQRTMSVHQEIMRAFVGPLPQGNQVRHLDGNPLNNSLINLAYGTPKENAADRRSGDYEGVRLLSYEQIEKIRFDALKGMRAKDIAIKHGIDVERLSSLLDIHTLDIRRELMLKCIQGGITVKVAGEYFGLTSHSAVSQMIKKYYGGVRALRNKYPLNKSLSVKDVPRIIGLE